MSCFVQYAPYHLQEGSGTSGARISRYRRQYAVRVRAEPAQHRSSSSGRHAAGPRTRVGLSGEHFPGRAHARAVFFCVRRRVGHNYRAPIKNLYMCGSATHPGGGIMGAPGRNAALRSGRYMTTVVIGAGHNGLTAAFYLAKAGLEPIVFERAETFGRERRYRRIASAFGVQR